MKFKDWKILNESLTTSALKTLGDSVKKTLSSEFGNLYMIPDFDTFERDGEPIQQNVLFTDKSTSHQSAKTFGFNYTSNGSLFSVDFWKGLSSIPSVTLYVNKAPMKDIFSLVPKIAEDPRVDLNLNKLLNKESVLEKKEDKTEAEIKTAKPIKELDPEVKKLEDEYDFSDPDTIFEDLEEYVNMVIKGTQPSLLITGSPGVGKTYLVTKQLKDAKIKYLHVKGKSTAAGMYITLFEHNGETIVFDDCDSIFGNADGINILKGALDTEDPRNISWLAGRDLKSTSGKKIPQNFDFTGKVIFISNLPQKKIDKAIKSRSFVIEVALTPEDMLKKMKKEIKNVSPHIPLPLREEALEFIEEVSKTAENLELNMRTLVKAIKILKDVSNLDVAERLIMQQCSYR
jgi:hypothetical protein